MALPGVFNAKTTEDIFKRLEAINYTSTPLWGKMNAAQMLAHLNVAYDFAYGRKNSNLNFFAKLMVKLFVKNIVVSEKPYPKNSRTAPDFIISNERDFEKEKSIFIDNVKETESKGIAYFEGKENSSFGVLTSQEWSNLFYKHLDHHFKQFGA